MIFTSTNLIHISYLNFLFRQPKPGTDKYYRGGWITQIHGSRDGGTIDAIQLEFPTEIRTEVSEEKRNIFINKLAQNINIFMNLFYTF